MNNFNRNFHPNNMNNRNMRGSGMNNRNMKGGQPQSGSQSPSNTQKTEIPKPQGGEEQLDNLVNKASKHLNSSPEEIKKAAQSGNLQKLLSNMSPSQAAQLEKILSDENAAKKLLSTPQAQALLRGLHKNE